MTQIPYEELEGRDALSEQLDDDVLIGDGGIVGKVKLGNGVQVDTTSSYEEVKAALANRVTRSGATVEAIIASTSQPNHYPNQFSSIRSKPGTSPITGKRYYPAPGGLQLGQIMGLTQDTWNRAISVAVILHHSQEEITIENIIKQDTAYWHEKVNPHNYHLLTQIIAHPDFGLALEERGIVDMRQGLSEIQMLALGVLTNFTDKRSLNQKLASIGVTKAKFQSWLSDPRFKQKYRAWSEQLFSEAQASVNVSLTQQAVDGDIRAIKYFNELSGRFDPQSKQVADVKSVLQGMVEIVSSVLANQPDKLREIAGRLQLLIASKGIVIDDQ